MITIGRLYEENEGELPRTPFEEAKQAFFEQWIENPNNLACLIKYIDGTPGFEESIIGRTFSHDIVSFFVEYIKEKQAKIKQKEPEVSRLDISSFLKLITRELLENLYNELVKDLSEGQKELINKAFQWILKPGVLVRQYNIYSPNKDNVEM
jgi:hypothetical protein